MRAVLLAKIRSSAPLIAMAHEIPYVATATVADLRDLEAKVQAAMELRGARYLHVLVPCPLGWGSSPADTIKVARLATESGLFPVFEAEDGQLVSSARIRPVAVQMWSNLMGDFDPTIAAIASLCFLIAFLVLLAELALRGRRSPTLN